MIIQTYEVGTDSKGRPFRRPIMLYQPDGIRFHASSKLIEDEKVITSVSTWETLGGVVTNPSFFTDQLANSFGRVVASTDVTGTGAELRMVERDPTDDSEVVVSDVQALADTAGSWKAVKFSTNVPSRVGDMEYRIEGRLNGASAAKVRFASVSLLELIS